MCMCMCVYTVAWIYVCVCMHACVYHISVHIILCSIMYIFIECHANSHACQYFSINMV